MREAILSALRWVAERRRRRRWFKTGARLELLRRRAIFAVDEDARVAAIDAASAVFAELERAGAVTPAERRSLARDWAKAYARDRLHQAYTAKDAQLVAEMSSVFLKAG